MNELEYISNSLLGFVLQKSDKEIFLMCIKANGQTLDYYFPGVRPDMIKPKDLPDVLCNIDDFSRTHRIDIPLLLRSIKTRFIKDQKCMDYIFKMVNEKLKPSSDTGFQTLRVKLPYELGFLLSAEDKEHVIQKIQERFGHRLTTKSQTTTIEWSLK